MEKIMSGAIRIKEGSGDSAEVQVALEVFEYLSVEEVATILRVSRSWAYKDRTLPWIKVGRLKRIHRADFNAFMAAKRKFTLQSIMRHTTVGDSRGQHEPID